MTYQWTQNNPSDPESPNDTINLALSDGTVQFDISIKIDAGTRTQTAAAMGSFKDALEGAGWTLQQINTGSTVGYHLEDI